MHSTNQKLVSSRSVSGIDLIEVAMRTGMRVPKQRFPNASMQIVLSGGYREPSADAERRPLSVHFHPSDDPQDALVDQPSRIFGICIPGERLEAVDRYGGLPSEPADLSSPPVVDCMIRLYREFRAGNAGLAIESICCELLAHFSRRPFTVEGSPSWLARAYDIVAEEPFKSHSLSSIAEECGIHRSHLAREFRRKYGCSIGDHLRRSRCRLALDLLRTTDWPLHEIASRTGFHDSSHLSKAIRWETGHTPGAWRT